MVKGYSNSALSFIFREMKNLIVHDTRIFLENFLHDKAGDAFVFSNPAFFNFNKFFSNSVLLAQNYFYQNAEIIEPQLCIN